MGTTDDIGTQLTAVLNKAAKNLNLQKFLLNLDLSAHKGDGFLGEVYRVSILDESTNNKIDLIIKRAPTEERRRDETCIEKAYKNETIFYSKIFPILQKFQKERQVVNPFDSIPTFVAGVSELCKEIMVFKDITSTGYQMREKDLRLDDEHTKFIFQTYGRFHALSFCLKDQKPEEYQSLTKSFCSVVDDLSTKRGFSQSLVKIAERCLEALDPKKDSGVVEKFRKYVDSTLEILASTIKYDGEYAGIVHGDCWSNNMMFKYQEPRTHSKLEDVNLLDFQLIMVGTPVYDLSYFFYSGGSKELYSELELYLDIYHESFSKFARELGSDPEKLLPREILSEDWRKYSTYGMFMAFFLTRVKLMSKEESIQMTESFDEYDEKIDSSSKLVKANVNEELFDERIRDILVHMYEIDAL